MNKLFDIITEINEDEQGASEVSMGIKVKIAGKEIICPITEVNNSYESFKDCVDKVKEELDHLLRKAKEIFMSEKITALDLKTDAPPEEIWNALLSIEDEISFLEAFNNMDEKKRKEIADYILTHCNIFTGKGTFFSSRYNQQTGLLDNE